MNVQIRISGNDLADGAALRGRVYHDGALVADAERLAGSWQGMEGWAAGLARSNGFFALAHRRGEEVFAAVDRARSIPLFYAVRGNEAYLSDDARWVRDRLGAEEGAEPFATEFLLSSLVSGRDTLVAGMHQLTGGDLLRLAPGPGGMTAEVRPYWRYAGPSAPRGLPREELEERFDALLVRAFGRLMEVADGRTIVVPLSGGNDSRLVLAMLKRLGYPSLVTFTYGRPENREAVVSRRVAGLLDVPWHFVPYDNASWRRWFRSRERQDYYRMADGLSSLPLLLDWPAVGELRRQGIVPEGAVFTPGLSADLHAGSRSKRYPELYRPGLPPRDEVVQVLLRSGFALWDWSSREAELYPVLARRVAESLEDYERFDDGGQALEAWETRERQSKYIVNSVRAYEYWGCDWWLPFYDAEFLDFWPGVPVDLRMHRRFYRPFVERLFCRVAGLPEQAPPKTANHGWMGPAAKRLVINTPLYPLARSAYRVLRSYAEYERHLIAWYGMVPRDVFFRTPGWNSVISFLAAERLQRLDLLGGTRRRGNPAAAR